jgi:hypothetical protein
MRKILSLLLVLCGIGTTLSAQDTTEVKYAVVLWLAQDSTQLFKTTDSLKLAKVFSDSTGTIYVFKGKPHLLGPLKTMYRVGDANKTPIVAYAEYDLDSDTSPFIGSTKEDELEDTINEDN